MGWGNPQPLAQLKRDAHERARLAKQLAAVVTERDAAAATVAAVTRLADTHQHTGALIEPEVLALALRPPNRCALCISAYVECPIHVESVPE